ncbi:MAG: hypothetical protein AAGA00_13725 [Pseudomonadota bacterium]
MSRDLTKEEQQKFVEMYGTGSRCVSCGNQDVIVKIWEKHGTNAAEIGGDISPTGIVGALVTCDSCGHAETVARARILEAS